MGCRLLLQSRGLPLLAVLCTLASAPAPGPYECNDGRLISPSWVCDGYDDCSDGSDEADCSDTVCSALQFSCVDGSRCVSEQHVCDGDFDCGDHSDEQGCPQRECDESSEYRCTNNRCVHASFQCDGQDDCGDNSDEVNCIPDDVCSNMYVCGNNTYECIPLAWVCDGSADCTHAYDEMDCNGVDNCGRFGLFNCSKGGCVKAELVCDGDRDCPVEDDDSDEDCPKLECDTEIQFECRHSNGDIECISLSWNCDGSVDCFDEIGSDEANCVGSCEETEFNCVTGSQCVPNPVQCDGTEDCDDGSDEYLCRPARPIVCSNGSFPCHDNLECVGSSELCDGGLPECHDLSDEAPLWCDGAVSGVNECEGNSHGCEHRCHDTDHAYYCTCEPGYILDDNRKNCSDINECDDNNRCSQLCCNRPGSYECLCVEGYQLTENGVCKPLGSKGYLLLMDKVDIRSIQPVMGGGRVKKLIHDLAQTFAIDYHLGLQRMFWSELTFQGAVIKTAFLNRSNDAVIINTGLVSPHGLAVDWITNKIYWTDASRAHVTVAELDGSKRNVLVSHDMRKPRGIAVDPTTGYMYWTDWGSAPRIERASMDGTDRTVLHSQNIVWPNALTIDYATQQLYWIDAKLDFIESSFMDGTQRIVLYRELTRHFRPFGLTLFKDKLYMADIDAREVRSMDVKSDVRELTTVYSAIVEPMAVVAVHPVRQPHVRLKCLPNSICECENITEPVINPCEVANGGCEYMCVLRAVNHMCVLSSAHHQLYSCLCPTGHRLHPNGKNCLKLDQFLLLASNKEVYTVSLDVPHPVNVLLPLNDTKVVSAITWDSRDDTIYLADLGLRSISSADISGKNQQVVIEAGTVGRPVGLALDWLHNRLYWTDSEWNTIESCGLDGSWRTVVVYSGLDKPRDIVVDPERGLMFWSDWADRPRIMRSALDGTSKEALVRSGLDTPNGLGLDYKKKIVYWVDSVLDTLEKINYDGSNRQTILEFDLDVHLSGLDYYGNVLFWSDWKEANLMSANVSLPSDPYVMIEELVQVRDVNVFHRHRNHSATTPCSRRNGGCSHVCVTKARSSGDVKAACMCPLGFPLLDDRRTCASEINATLVFPTGSAIHQVSLDIDDYIAETINPVSGPAKTITSVAMDPINDIIYYANTVSFGVHRINLLDQTDTVILDQHPTAITSLAVDYASQNLYFIDSHERRLEVARADGSNRRVLHSGLVNPTGLAMDPVSLSLFYVDTGNPSQMEHAKIYSSAMDGSAQTVVVTTGIYQPLYIAVDNNGVDGRIFWTDSYYNRITTAAFDGRDQRVIVSFGDADGAALVHGIAFYKEHIYFSDVGRNIVYKSDLHGEKNAYLDGHDYLSDVQIVQPRQGNVRGCSNSSRCDYLCLPNPNVPSKQTCSCPTGIEIAADGRSCPKGAVCVAGVTVPNTFLLVAAQFSLRRIALDNPDGYYVDITLYDSRDGFEVNAVDYLLTGHEEGYVFCAEMRVPSGAPGDIIWRSRIIRRDLYSKNDTSAIILLTEVGIIEDIAVDWTTGNVYFTRNLMNNRSYIAVMDMNGHNVHTLITTDIHKPRGIALHPYEHLMFWTDYGNYPKIESAKMDGTRRSIIVSRLSNPFNLRSPNDVVVDLNTDLVYFTDGSTGLIGAVTISGNSGRVIVNKMVDNPDLRRSEPVTSYIRKPHSLSIRHLDDSHQDNNPNTEETEMFWTDPEFHTISATDLVTLGGETEGIEKSNLRSVLPRTTDYKPFAVQFVSSDGHRENEMSALSSTPCSQRLCDNRICVNINITHYQCLCPDSVPNCQTLTYRVRYSDMPRPPSTPPSIDPPSPPTSGTTSTDEQPSSGTGTGPTHDPTSDNESRGTTSSTGSPAEQQSNEGGEEEGPVKKVGIGLGTVIGVVMIAFAVFVAVAVYFIRRGNNSYDITERLKRYHGTGTRLRSLSSTSQSSTPRKSNSFRLPNKQSNVFRNNTQASTQQNVRSHAVNPSPSVNEFVEEPEVYELGPVPIRRSKRVQTPPDSPSLKKEAICESMLGGAVDALKTIECQEQSCTATVHVSLCDENLSDEIFLPPEKPTRSCLSSVSDTSQPPKQKRVLSVTFAEESAIDTSKSSSPPPPLPPKASEDDDVFVEAVAPPRPRKPALLLDAADQHDETQSIDKPMSDDSQCPSDQASEETVSDEEVTEEVEEETNGATDADDKCDVPKLEEMETSSISGEGGGGGGSEDSDDFSSAGSSVDSGSLSSTDESRPILNTKETKLRIVEN